MKLNFITAEEAAAYVHNGDNVGFSGFTPAGCPKVVSGAIARKAIAEHEKGNPFQIGMFTGASTGDKLDGELARADAIKFRTPYQSNKDLRSALNAHKVQYFDMHLSELPQNLRYGFLGSVVFFIAFLSLIGLGIDKMIELHQGVYGHLITDSPYFFIALTAMLLGSQLFLAGFLGDLISRQNPNRNDYQIEKEIRCGK